MHSTESELYVHNAIILRKQQIVSELFNINLQKISNFQWRLSVWDDMQMHNNMMQQLPMEVKLSLVQLIQWLRPLSIYWCQCERPSRLRLAQRCIDVSLNPLLIVFKYIYQCQVFNHPSQSCHAQILFSASLIVSPISCAESGHAIMCHFPVFSSQMCHKPQRQTLSYAVGFTLAVADSEFHISISQHFKVTAALDTSLHEGYCIWLCCLIQSCLRRLVSSCNWSEPGNT